MDWGFYGRADELRSITQIISRNRWYFAKMTGRRRIGKTTLIQKALQSAGNRPVFYVQVPDSGPAGVLSAVDDAMGTFGVPRDQFQRPRDFGELARLVGSLARAGYAVVLDEFQYFNRLRLQPFCSFLQAEVDRLASDAGRVPGGLLVLGSIHTEMMAVLEDRSAPLYNRTTDEITLTHLDIASLKALLREHADLAPERLLFLWTLFEGVPKFYRDCYEQGVLNQDRPTLLRRIFFESSSPLRTEAENWFLKELRGQYDVVLKFVARHAGCLHNELMGQIQQVSGESSQQVGGYLKVLSERYRLIEKKLPVFAAERARRGRYYLTDNFLRAWLAALAGPVAALNFRPVEQLVADADVRLHEVEGSALEKLVGLLYEERSRKGVGDFPLTEQVRGYWDRSDTEIDVVAINENDKVIRFGSCKRSADELIGDLTVFDGHVERFLDQFPRYRSWKVEKVSLAPRVPEDVRRAMTGRGRIVQDLTDLIADL
jgi:AAA+ ATPase superfamily predicted ATPase